MVADLKPQALGDGVLALFDPAIHELFHFSAVNTHDVIVMRALVEFENRHAALEVMARDQARGFELGEHPVDGGEADVLIGDQQLFINVFRAHVTRGSIGEDVQDFKTWQRDFETGITQVVALTARVRL